MDAPEDEADDDRPWSEEKWEAFLKEGDLRAARFGEILETVMDHPDRDRIIAQEMGWDWLLEEGEDEDEGGGREAWAEEDDTPEDAGDADGGTSDADAEEASGAAGEAGGEGKDDSADDAFGDEDDDVHEIPAYRLATEVGMKVHEALRPYTSKLVPEDEQGEPDIDERWGQASIGCHIAAAKIAGGHGMGYEDEVLCGNIVNCRRGLEGAEQGERALLSLRDEGLLPAEIVDPLLPQVRAVIEAVRERIAELRSRVWW